MNDRAGQQIGNYKLVQLLGSGGFADVYLGKHIFLDSSAAIKLLHTNLTDDGIEGFRAEARTLVNLLHPNIVRILEFGLEGQIPFLVMDYAPNGNMRQRCRHGRQLPLPQVVEFVRQVASALQYAHSERIIHRDVKPENMLVGRQNEIVLSDFGIAVVAQSTHAQLTQEMTGTIAYMAPEQIQAHPRPASDQYSLAVVTYEWLSGAPPFSGTFTEIGVKHMMTPPRPLREQLPGLPPEVEQVILTALAKEPSQRFSSIQDFALALARASNNSRTMFAATMPAMLTPIPPSRPMTPMPPLISSAPVMEGYANQIPTQMAPPVLARPESSRPEISRPAVSAQNYTDPPIAQAPLITTYGNQAISAPPSQVTEPERKGMSRRAVLIGSLSAAGMLVAGGVAWQIISHGSASPGNLANSQRTTPQSGPKAAPDPRQIGLDTFQRPDQTLWGIASDGKHWSGDVSTSQECSIEQKTGQITRKASGHDLYSAIMGDAHPDVEILFTARLSSFNNSHLGAMARFQNENHYYKVILDGSKLHIIKRIDANNDPAIGVGVSVSPKANTLYTIRFRVDKTTISAKYWPASEQEPDGWMVSGTDDDTSFQNGTSGLRPQLNQNATLNVTSFQSMLITS